MPGPVSAMEKRSVMEVADRATCATERETEPWAVNLMALPSRLTKI